MSDRFALLRDARSVFLPAINEVALPEHIGDHLAGGGVSVLLGESRDEYVARQMTESRRRSETPAWFGSLSGSIRDAAGGPVLVAVDQELGGIQRLHDLVTPLPSSTSAAEIEASAVEASAQRLALEANTLGVNVVLAPIVDVVAGPNPWLDRRTLSQDGEIVRRVASAFVRGVQHSGRVAATAKHFPGHPHMPLDPAVDPDAVVEADLAKLEPSLDAFRGVIEAGVKVVMVGPALVPVLDTERAASRSGVIVDMLKRGYGFDGVVLSDDLDQLGVLRGDSIHDAAVDALNAGVDWLLVAGTLQLPELVAGIADAVEAGLIDRDRLADAADRVRALAHALT